MLARIMIFFSRLPLAGKAAPREQIDQESIDRGVVVYTRTATRRVPLPGVNSRVNDWSVYRNGARG